MNENHYKQRPIIITGAGGGLGCKLVDELFESGYSKIICTYKSKNDALKRVFDKHAPAFFETCCRQVDLTREDQVKSFHEYVSEQLGHVWGLVNLAGASSNAMSWKMSVEQFRNVIDDNLLSTFIMCREFIPDMRSQEEGRIINVSSVTAFAGAVGAAHYCAAKSGIVGLSKALALELAPKSVTVNVLGLGYYDAGLIGQIPEQGQQAIKDKTPLKRFGEPEEIFGFLDVLLSDSSAFMTGQVVHINGGYYV